jgi:DNA-binding PadR family transcriptional regulator
MAAVFRHGGLRLYLLQLLDEQPRHGYDVISLLEDRFLGLYAPSAGTVYPRLAKLETEGLVEHDEADGRKVYRLTDAGREELAGHVDELRDLEAEISQSVADLARDVRSEVRASVRGLREELKTAAREVRRETRAQTRRDARRPDSLANGTAYARLAEEVAALTRDSLAAARDADEAGVLAAVAALQRAHSEVLALLGEHT